MVSLGQHPSSVQHDLTMCSAHPRLTGAAFSPVFRTFRFMTRTRTPVLFLLVFSLVALLTACGKDSNKSSDAKSNGSTNDTSAQLAATTLNASGATFPQPFYEQVIAGFSEKHPGVTINYGGGGSGKGRTDLQ